MALPFKCQKVAWEFEIHDSDIPQYQNFDLVTSEQDQVSGL